MKRAICNVAVGGNYPAGQDRLAESLGAVGETAARIFYRDAWPANCPPHSEAPYLFKVAAFRAARAQGKPSALWMDASCWAAAGLEPVWQKIETEGAFIVGDGWTVGQWSTDECLRYFGLTREQAHEIPLNYAICMGFNLRDAAVLGFLNEWERAGRAGMFRGPWRFAPGTAEYDAAMELMPESARAAGMVPGHRHDQTVASILIHRHGLPYGNAGELFQRWQAGKTDYPGAAILAAGL